MKTIVTIEADCASGGREAWFRTVTGFNPSGKGAQYFVGEYIKPDVQTSLEIGSLVIGVHPKGTASYGVDCARLYSIQPNGKLNQVGADWSWKKQFPSFTVLVEMTFETIQTKPEIIDSSPIVPDLSNVKDEILIAELGRRGFYVGLP